MSGERERERVQPSKKEERRKPTWLPVLIFSPLTETSNEMSTELLNVM